MPELDRYIGGLFPGNSLLLFRSNVVSEYQLFSPLLHWARGENVPLLCLSATVSVPEFMRQGNNVRQWNPQPKAKTASAVINSVKRFVASQPNHRCIIVDELSSWKSLLKNEKNIVALVEAVTHLALKKKALLVYSADRSQLSRETLAMLKEQVTICLDVHLKDQDCYIIPLVTKFRYIPHNILPLRIPLKEFLVSRRSSASQITEVESAEHQIDRLPMAFQQNESRFATMFNDAAEAMVLFDLKGDYREVNKRCAQILGYTMEELSIINPLLIAPYDKFRVTRFLYALPKKKNNSVTVFIKKKDGKSTPFEFHASAVKEGIYLGILRDSSARVETEEQVRQMNNDYHELLHHADVAIVAEYKGKILYASQEGLRLFGLTLEELPDRQIKNLFSPQSWKLIQAKIREGIDSGRIELTCIRKDGSSLVCLVRAARIELQGKDCTEFSFLDISERKKAEMHLTSSIDRYRAIVDSAGEAAAFFLDGKFYYPNAAFVNLFGIDNLPHEHGVDINTVLPQTDIAVFTEAVKKQEVSRKSSFAQFEVSGIAKGSKTIDLSLVVYPRSVGGHSLVYFHDQTAAKVREREVQRQQQDLDLLKEIIATSTGTLDLQKLLRIGVDKLLEVLHWEMGAVFLTNQKKKEFELALHHHFPERMAATLSSLPLDEGLGGFATKTQEPHLLKVDHYPSYLPYKSLFKEYHIKGVCLLPLIAREKIVGLMLTCSKKDASVDDQSMELLTALSRQLGNALENALTYQRVKHEEEQYQSLVEASPDVMYTALPNGSFIFISPQVTQLSGYSPKDFYRNATLWLSLIHADDKKIVLGRTTNLEDAKGTIVSEYRLIPKGKAAPRWVRDELSLKRDEQGAIKAMTGIVRDITRSREIVEQLQLKSKRDSAIFSNIKEGVIVFDKQLKCTGWNTAMKELSGFDEADVVGKRAEEISLFGSVENVHSQLHQVLRGEVMMMENIPFTRQDGGTVYCTLRLAPLTEEHQSGGGLVAVATETTERVETKNNIRATEQVLTNVIDTMDDILIITDLKGTVLQVNKSFLRVLGYTRSEAIGFEFPYSWLVEEEMSRFVLWIANLRERSWLHDFDMTWRAKDGRLIPMSLSTTLLRNSLGEPIAMLNIARDITERTKLAKDLETRSKQVELINRIISKANQTNDFDEVFVSITEEVNKFIPADTISIGLLTDAGKALEIFAMGGIESLKKGDIIPVEQTVSQYSIKTQKPVVISDLALNPQYSSLLSLSKGLRSQVSLPIILKGKPFGTLNIGSKEPHTFTEDHANILSPVAQQIGTIIDRIQLFKKVTEDSVYIRNLLDSIDSIVYTVDTRCRILEVNKAWHEFMKESEMEAIRDYHGMYLFDILPSEQLKIVFQNVVDQLLSGSVRIFSQEYVHTARQHERIFQLTINPMIIDHAITGLVFTHTDITALKITERELKKSNKQLLALNEISSLINTSFDLQDILKAAIPLLKNTLEASAVLVYLIEHPSNDLYLAEQTGFDVVRFPSIIRLKQESSATGTVVGTKEALYLPDSAFRDERIKPENREVMRDANIESLAVIPLVSKDKVLGALDIFYTKPHVFYRQEQQMLELIGNQLGSTIENAQLYSELRSQIDRLTVLYELSQQLTSLLDIQQIFHAVFESIQQIVPFERFAISIFDAAQETITPAYLVETVKGISEFIQQESLPVQLVPGSDEATVVGLKRPFQTFDRHTTYVPMVSKETIIGIMSIQSSWAEEYTETHFRLLESIGNLTALALEKGKLYEETLQKSREIQQRNKELDDFTYVVSHDLKEPLISIEGFSRILQMDYQEVIQLEGKEYLESIVGATTRMKGLIDDLLMLSRVSRPSESFKPVAIPDIIRDITTDMEFTIKQKGVKIIAENLPTIIGNETQLKLVFRNLIGNAIKFNNKPNPVVEVGFRNAENNAYLFYVRDNGIGIDPDFHQKIFVIFQRLHRREEYEGSGAGLAIVKKIIEIHKGRIWVESKLGEGATFYFTIQKFVES